MLCRICILKHFVEGKKEGTEDEEEVVSSYCMTLRKNKGTENRKKGSTRWCSMKN